MTLMSLWGSYTPFDLLLLFILFSKVGTDVLITLLPQSAHTRPVICLCHHSKPELADTLVAGAAVEQRTEHMLSVYTVRNTQ